jgi:hypothetical protein
MRIRESVMSLAFKASRRHVRTARARGHERGAISIFVLVCLLVIGMICAAILRIGFSERARLRVEERRLQAEWLVESGLERGAAKLAASPAYAGETWDLPAEELGGGHTGRVTISVEGPAKGVGLKRLRVRAEYPRDGALSIRLTKEITVGGSSAPGNKTP